MWVLGLVDVTILVVIVIYKERVEVWELSFPTSTRWVTRNKNYSYEAYNAFIMCTFRVHDHHIHDNKSEVSYQV